MRDFALSVGACWLFSAAVAAAYAPPLAVMVVAVVAAGVGVSGLLYQALRA